LPLRGVKFGCESSILWFEKLKFRPKSRAEAGSLEFLPPAAIQRVRQIFATAQLQLQTALRAKFEYLREIKRK